MKIKISDRVERKVSKLFGHGEYIIREQLAERVYECKVEGRKGRGRSYTKWMD